MTRLALAAGSEASNEVLAGNLTLVLLHSNTREQSNSRCWVKQITLRLEDKQTYKKPEIFEHQPPPGFGCRLTALRLYNPTENSGERWSDSAGGQFHSSYI